MDDVTRGLARRLYEFTDREGFNFWMPEAFLEGTEHHTLIRARMLIAFVYLMSLFIVPYLFFYSIVYYQPTTLAWLGGAAVPLIMTPVLLKWSERLDVAAHFTCLTTLTITAGISLTSGTPFPAGIPWLLLAPAYAVIFSGFREAFMWLATAVAAAVFIYVMAPSVTVQLSISELRGLQLQLVFGSVGLFVFVTCLFGFQDVLNKSLLQQLGEARERLRRQAIYDDLTDLPNRTLFRDRLKQAIRRGRRREDPIVVGFLDIDDFKEVNDTFGHRIGDEVLAEVGGRIGEMVRGEDTVARLGGDEFIFIFERAHSRTDVEAIAERLRSCFERPIDIGDHAVSVAVSIGFARFDPRELTGLGESEVAETLRKAADRAMYRAKEARGTDWRLSSVDTVFRSENPFEIRQAVREGVSRGEFIPYYQPIVRVDDEAMVATEVLMRWHHPERGVLSPGEFMPAVEGTQLIHEIQVSMMSCVHRQFSKLPRQAANRLEPIRILVNLSPDQLANSQILELLEGEMETEQPEIIRYSFEVTESGLLQAEASVQRLRQSGYKLIVDDFGTGYSSLNRLREFNVDALKIAMEFVQNIETDINRAIVENIADLGRRLDLPVIAEGVETQQQLDVLRDVEGCSFAQGYYLGRPQPFEDFLNRLGRKESPVTLFSAGSTPSRVAEPTTGN